MKELQIGDLVTLKSGGPPMTISHIGKYSGGFSIGPENGAECVWFQKAKKLESVFDIRVLMKFED